jgi:hypothetical protein
MRRIQFIEIHDSDWCPATIRDAATDNLQFALGFVNQYAPIAPRLARALLRTGTRQIVDLCSGGGGPWLRLSRMLEEEVHAPIEVCLTDKYPNMRAFEHARLASENRIVFRAKPVDAPYLPPELNGFRTFFTCFHHFPPPEARAILKSAVDSRQGIAVFEPTDRGLPALFLMLLAPIVALLIAPLIRPFSWSRLLWTYLIPVAPFVNLFDGIVSCLRTYSVSELREMTDELGECGYVWEIGRERGSFPLIPITYLIGYPALGVIASSVHQTWAR